MIKKSLGQILYEGRNHLGRWHLCNQSDWEQDAELVRIAVLEREGVEQLRARYANLEKENIRINEIIDQHAVRFDTLAVENVRLRSKNTDLLADVGALHNQVDTLTETIDSFKLENEELTEQFLLADAAISQLRAELAQTKREGEMREKELRRGCWINDRLIEQLKAMQSDTGNTTRVTQIEGETFVGTGSIGRVWQKVVAEPTLVPWTAFAEIPLEAWYRHKSSTTSKKIRRIDGERLNFQDQEQTRRGDWLTVAELCEQYDYSLDGREFQPCGKVVPR